MARAKRIQLAGACYYIVLQGNNKQDLFMSNQDRRLFLSLLRLIKERHELTVYAYCLMTHEAYLLVETRKANLSAAMQSFNTLYTKAFNNAHNTSGHLFQGRYKALIVDKEHFLSEMTRFIHLQPAVGGLREKPWRYQWSSLAAYVESEQGETLVDSEPVLAQFGKTRLKQSVRYLQFIKDRLKSASSLVLPVVRGAAVGSEGFLARMAERGSVEAGKGLPQAPGADDVRRVLDEVSQSTGIPLERLTGPLQWRPVAAARRQAVYKLWKGGMTMAALGGVFNRTPSAVSQMVRSVEEKTLALR